MTGLLAKTFSIETRELWFQLRQPYFQEELLRPVFVWGVGLGALCLIAALLVRDDRMKMTALLVLAASGLAVIPYLGLRADVSRGTHPGREPSAKVARLRQDSRWVFLTVGSLALVTAIWGARTRYGGALTVATLVAGLAATGTGAWLEAHDSGAMHFSARSTPRNAPRPAATDPQGPGPAPARSAAPRPAATPRPAAAPRPAASPAKPAADAPPRSLPPPGP